MAIQEHFLLELFSGHMPITVDDDFHHLLSHSIRRARLGIWNPTMVADHLYEPSKEATEILAENLASGDEFSLEAHQDKVKALRAALRKDWTTVGMDFLAN